MSTERPLLSHLTLAIGLFLLLCAAGSAMWLTTEQRQAEAWVQHGFDVSAKLDQLRISSQIIEIDRRGYVLNGRADDLARFTAEGRQLPHIIDDLARLTIDNPRQQVRIPALRRAVGQWLASRARSMRLRAEGQTQAAAQMIGTGESRATMGRMVGVLEAFRGDEVRLLADREVKSGLLRVVARVLLLVSITLAFLLAGLVAQDRRRQLRALRLVHGRLEEDIRKRQAVEAQLALLAAHATDAVFRLGLDGVCIYASPSVRHILGYSPHALVGRNMLTRFHPDDADHVVDGYRQLASGAVERNVVSYRAERPGDPGGWIWLEANNGLVRDEDGAPMEVIASLRDVSARMAAEAAQRTSERLYRLLADNSSDMIVRLGLDGIRHYVSPASVGVLGYAPDELVGRSGVGEIHPDDRANAIAAVRSLVAGVDTQLSVFRERRKDGSYAWLEVSYRLVRDPDTDAAIEIVASARDVSRRQAAELESIEATSRLREGHRLLTMSETVGQIGHWRVDLASGSVFWSDIVCAIHGQPAGYAPMHAAAIDAYHIDDRSTVRALVDRAITSAAGFDFNARIVRPDGVVRHVVSRGRAECAPDGEVIGLFGVFQDVTEAYEADRALRDASRRLGESNRLLSMAETVAQLGHWRLDWTNSELIWSDETYRIYGLPFDTVPTVELALSLYHPDDRARVQRSVEDARARQTGYVSRARIVRPDGTVAHILTRGEADHDADGRAVGLFGIVQDITEQVMADQQREEREARFRLITEQASDMISLHGPDGRCLFISPSVGTILGHDPSEIVGRTFHDLIPIEDHPLFQRHRADLYASRPGEVRTTRFRMRRNDGALVWIEVAARTADYRGEARVIAVCRDVTDQVRIQVELQHARVQAEAAAKAKASFLANMSHEIRTPMNGVVGFTELLLAGDLLPEQRQQAELIANSGRAMMRLLNDILDLSKVEAGQMRLSEEPFDLPHALKACVELVRPAVTRKGLALLSDFALSLPRMVVGDGLRLRQIVLNLLGNAAKFTIEGTITLAARAAEDRSGIVIEVRDTGIGIAADRQAAVFEQFVQAEGDTAPRFGGTGLGLAISDQLAQLMGGALRLESTIGRGTSFFLTVPLTPVVETVATPPVPVAISAPPGRVGSAYVLVAEDHEVNQFLITAMLKRLGHRVDVAGDGAIAVAMATAARGRGEPYAAVLMDMQMPNMDGLEATRRLRASGFDAATLPILALTANAFADDIAACRDAGMQAHLSKPLQLRDLESALGQWLPVAGVIEGGCVSTAAA